MKPSRSFLVIAALVTVSALAVFFLLRPAPASPIRIGVLHSLTGTMATSERPLVDAMRLAVEEINAAGGLLGSTVEMVVADGKSDDKVFAAEAGRLIATEKVSALFACWTSSCRKAVKPVVEKHNHLMLYPLQYEGLEQSPNIYYLGSAPNQQIIPGVRWVFDNLGKRVYLLGSDYIFPRVANYITLDLARASGATVLAERYQPLGATGFDGIVEEIRKLKPDAVLNTINGDSNLHFFRAMRKAGLDSVPVLSFSIAENDLAAIVADGFHPSHYAAWSYFQSLPGEPNRRFVAAFKARFGQERATSDPVEAAYTGVLLWAQAVRDAGAASPQEVNRSMLRQSIASPSGVAAVDRHSRHLWKEFYIGRARPDGQFEIVKDSGYNLRPKPFPEYRALSEWKKLAETFEGIKP